MKQKIHYNLNQIPYQKILKLNKNNYQNQINKYNVLNNLIKSNK